MELDLVSLRDKILIDERRKGLSLDSNEENGIMLQFGSENDNGEIL